ncbi:MAG: major capsid protein [Taibaiella sp.]|nr:major capsid protein [Taibaiella sp.]
MAIYTFPTQAELMLIAQDKTPRLTADRPAFQLLPIRETRASLIRWDQRDNFTGLQGARGLNGDPTRVKRLGAKTYQMEPGVYGEFERIDEYELTTRRAYGTWNQPIAVDDLVMEAQDHLLGRRLDRIEYIIWTLLVYGTFSVATPYGPVVHTDAYTTQTFTAGVTWATQVTATPLANFRAIQLLGRGRSANFGGQATAYMNRTTFNQMIANNNQQDLAGRRTAGLATVLSPNDLNMVLANEDLPRIVIYDEGYLDESGTFQLFIPNNKVVVIGKRPQGQTIGEYLMTFNANNPSGAPGPYMKVINRGEETVPISIEVHDGHSGGPALYFPGSIVVMSV